MQLSQSVSMRMGQQQVLTPRMIQSMEILQLPLAALEERIDEELVTNPVLELKQDSDDRKPDREPVERDDAERTLIVDENSGSSADFNRLEKLADYLENEEFSTNDSFRSRRPVGGDGERDGKLDAIANTMARSGSLAEHLIEQWSLLEIPKELDLPGRVLITQIEPDGYLRTPLDQIRSDNPRLKNPAAGVTPEHMTAALKLIQTLEPAGVGARDLQECLLLQLDALEDDEEMAEGHDFLLERALIRHHLKDLELNRYPQISKKLERPIDELKSAVRRLARLHPHPGKQIGIDEAPPITPDAVVYRSDETGRYEIRMTHEPADDLSISAMYRKLLKQKTLDRKSRDFLNTNVRNARWLIESLRQRSSTIKRVIRLVVDAQQEFFERGPEALKPLPMIQVADQLGIHVATVSRAVSEKWIQTPSGVFPLRRFFSQGTTSSGGEDMSWDAVKEKLKQIVAAEDPQNPLNDDEIVDRIKAQGIELARRTVAKYRKILDIPTARQRKQF